MFFSLRTFLKGSLSIIFFMAIFDQQVDPTKSNCSFWCFCLSVFSCLCPLDHTVSCLSYISNFHSSLHFSLRLVLWWPFEFFPLLLFCFFISLAVYPHDSDFFCWAPIIVDKLIFWSLLFLLKKRLPKPYFTLKIKNMLPASPVVF